MINVSLYGEPLFFQTIASYALPSVTGVVQWNGLSKKFQVSNGHSWLDIDNTVTLNTGTEVTEVIKWAKEKMAEEQKLELLAKENKTVADLLEQRKEIDSKIEMVKNLVAEQKPLVRA